MTSNMGRGKLVSAVAALLMACQAGVLQAVEYANITVVDGSPSNTATPTVTIAQSTAGAFNIDDAHVKVGEIPIRIGLDAADDAPNGVLMVSASETARFPVGSTATNGLSASTSIVRDEDFSSVNTRDITGGLSIVIDRAGTTAAGSLYPTGSPMNNNVAAAYFPYTEGWKGGYVYPSTYTTNGFGAIDTFTGSSAAQMNVDIKPDFVFVTGGDPATFLGDHFVHLPEVVDTRQQGILLTMVAKNENNFAAVTALANGEGWHVNTRGNEQSSPGDGESRAFSFVFVPVGMPNVTMASVYGAAGADSGPVAVLKSGANFQIVKAPNGFNGNYRLTIDGQSPATGALFAQTESNFIGSGGEPSDNLITYRPDGDGWIIVSKDMAGINQNNGQNPDQGERTPYFDFVFMPFNATIGPPTIQAPAWDKSSVFSFNVGVTEIRNANNQNDADGADMHTAVTAGTVGLDMVASRMNKGDNAVHVAGALPTGNDGVMLVSVSQGFRVNATGGGSDFGVASASLTGNPSSWEVHTHRASPLAEEFNIDYSVAFFGRQSNFQMANDVPTDASGNGHLDLVLSGVNSESDGVLMLNSEGNGARFATVKPKSGGAGWDVDVQTTGLLAPGLTTGTPPVPVANVNYVFLPYDTENLVAGRVAADGSIINSTGVGTDPGEFTLAHDPLLPGQYVLTVAGRTPSQGALLLTPGAGFDSVSDNTISYEADGSNFRIFGIDLVTQAEKDLGTAISLEDTAFSFAFIDYITPPEAAPVTNFLAADFDHDGFVDGDDLQTLKNGFGTGTMNSQGDADLDGDVDGNDFLVFQRQLGSLPTSAVAAGAVPEPGSLALMAVAVAGMAMRRRLAA